jgi:hypothetical protein
VLRTAVVPVTVVETMLDPSEAAEAVAVMQLLEPMVKIRVRRLEALEFHQVFQDRPSRMERVVKAEKAAHLLMELQQQLILAMVVAGRLQYQMMEKLAVRAVLAS